MAYALRPLPPDDRDGRVFPPPRRPRRGLMLIVALAVMLASAGGLWALYRAMMSVRAPGEAPLIRADDQPTRKRPSDPGGMQAPGQGTLVLDGHPTGSKVEQLLPPPEAPLPRPTPLEPTAVAAPEPTAPPVVGTPPQTVAPSVAVATAVPPPQSKPAPAITAVAPPPPTTAANGYRVQLGAVRSAEAAKQDWDRLRHQNGDLLGALSLNIERVTLRDRGTFYRIQAGPLADASAAERNCRELKRRGVACVLVRP